MKKKKKKKRDKWWLQAEMALEERGNFDLENLPPLPLEDHDWQAALQEVERKKDLGPLLIVLRKCVPRKVIPHVEDLFDRYQLKFKKGKQTKIPSYMLSIAEVLIEIGCAKVAQLVAGGTDEDKAVRKAAKEYLIPHDTLENAYETSVALHEGRKKKAPPKTDGANLSYLGFFFLIQCF